MLSLLSNLKKIIPGRKDGGTDIELDGTLDAIPTESVSAESMSTEDIFLAVDSADGGESKADSEAEPDEIHLSEADLAELDSIAAAVTSGAVSSSPPSDDSAQGTTADEISALLAGFGDDGDDGGVGDFDVSQFAAEAEAEEYDPEGDIPDDQLSKVFEAAKDMDSILAEGAAVDLTGAPAGDDEDAMDAIDAELWDLINKDKAITENVHALDDERPELIDTMQTYDVVDGVARVGDDKRGQPHSDEIDALKAMGVEFLGAVEDQAEEKPKNALVKLLTPLTDFLDKHKTVPYIALIVLMAAGITGLTIGLITYMGKVGAVDKSIEVAKGSVIKQPELGRLDNDANFIFLNEARMIDGIPLAINKISQDDAATVVYFNAPVDLSKYTVTLYDGSDATYPLLPAYLPQATHLIRTRTALRFKPLRRGAMMLVVVVRNKDTGETVDYRLRVDGGIKSVAPTYLEQPFNADNGLIIDGVTLSTDSTDVTFSLRPDYGYTRLYAKEGESVKLAAYSNKTLLLPMTESADLYDFGGGLTVGVMRFAPVKALAGTLDLTFGNLYGVTDLDLEMEAANMFVKGDDRAVTLSLYGESLSLTLEGMQKQGALVVLVANAEDLTKPESDNKYARRVKVDITAEIVVGNGLEGDEYEEYYITGDCRSDWRGADVLFRIPDDAPRYVRTARGDQVRLKVYSVGVARPDFTVSIDVDELFGAYPNADVMTATSTITRSLERRLSYRSGIGNLDSLANYFDESLLEGAAIARYYPMSEQIRTRDAVQVTAVALEGDMVYAVAAEYSDPLDGSEMMFGVHKLTVKKDGRLFVIVNDEIAAKKTAEEGDETND